MDFQHALRSSLEEATAAVSEVLAYLQNAKPASTNSQSGPADPLENAPRRILHTRKKLAEAATRLVQLGTRPEEYLEHLTNSYQEQTCVRWLVDLNVLQHLPLVGAVPYATLAIKASVPESQLKGVARMAVCNGFLEEPQPGHVAHSRMSGLLVRDEKFMNWARWMVDYSMPVAYRYADATRRWGETDARDQTAFQLAMDTTDPFFDYIQKSAEMTDLFSGYMRNVTASGSWSLQHAVDGFDWASLPPGAKIVDVGGSHGQLAVQVAKQFPHLNFVVQDLAETVATAANAFEADDAIEASVKSRVQFMAADFFKPQPVTDAQVYFLRMIIHDWPDKDALVILKHLQTALKANPSARIVLMDTVLPPPGSIPVLLEQQLRTRDLMMKQVFNAKERELEDWKSLASRVGMEVTQVKQPLDSVMGLLTVQLDSHREETLAPIVRNDSPLGHSTNGLPVLIMGGGISGLCLAQALNKANIDFLVFERDAAVDSRPQGYRLKLEKDGAQALLDCLPADIYHTFETSCAATAIGETDFCPFSGTITKSRAGGGLSGELGLHPRYTVDRTAFRESLMTGIKDRIFFGKELSSYQLSTDCKTVTATFKDGSRVDGRFLVGADGLHSAVRRQFLPQQKLVDTGASCVYGKTALTPELQARFPAKALRWMTVASDSAPMLQSCLIGDSPVTLLAEPIRFSAASRKFHPDLAADYVYWALIGPKARFLGGSADPAELSLEITREWHPSMRALFELQETGQATLIRIASEVPAIAPWESSPLVVLLGDAVHPMSPCGGVGANTGLCDAAALGHVLKEADGSPKVEAIAAFEADMRSRAARMIARAEIGSKKMFGLKSLVECEPWNENI